MQEHNQSEFLEHVPPGTRVRITDFEEGSVSAGSYVAMPDIELHCTVCGGTRVFSHLGGAAYLNARKPAYAFLHYHCRNCRSTFKTFAVSYSFDEAAQKWTEFKFGEDPAFGPPTPARAISLIGPDKDQFLKGRRCENQGLGVGAFAYYRRVVENQKNHIFGEIIRVSKHLGADEQLLNDLKAAQKETQFTRAVESIKHALPQSLMINGNNPLKLLHSALSEGVHDLSDEQCLEVASDVRVILFEFAERISQAMKDEAELNEAVNRLANKKAD